MNVNITIIGRGWVMAAIVGCAALVPSSTALGQSPVPDTAALQRDSIALKQAKDSIVKVAKDSVAKIRNRFFRRMGYGFATSILAHEAGHFVASYSMGYHPHLGIDKGRPTVFSGINEFVDKHKQFIFSAAGMTVQDVIDEIVLDIPHARGGAFERGILTGGIGTTLFYVTAGRNANVSDISVMARNSGLSKSQLSAIFGSVAAIQAFRAARNHRYSHFFAAPTERGGIKTGLSINTH